MVAKFKGRAILSSHICIIYRIMSVIQINDIFNYTDFAQPLNLAAMRDFRSSVQSQNLKCCTFRGFEISQVEEIAGKLKVTPVLKF